MGVVFAHVDEQDNIDRIFLFVPDDRGGRISHSDKGTGRERCVRMRCRRAVGKETAAHVFALQNRRVQIFHLHHLFALSAEKTERAVFLIFFQDEEEFLGENVHQIVRPREAVQCHFHIQIVLPCREGTDIDSQSLFIEGAFFCCEEGVIPIQKIGRHFRREDKVEICDLVPEPVVDSLPQQDSFTAAQR